VLAQRRPSSRPSGEPVRPRFCPQGRACSHGHGTRSQASEASAGASDDESIRLPPPHDDVTILGMDDPLTRRGVTDRLTHEATVGAALENVHDVPVKIALCHSPDGFRSVRGKGIALYLCGHTHGGHIALPGYRPIIMPSPDGRLWPWGLHDVDGTRLFVSRGVGGSLVPVRTWAPPDVAVFTIHGSA